MRKSFVSACALGLMASWAAAEVSLQYTPSTVIVNQPADIALSLVANPGFSSTIGSVILDFTGGPTGPQSNLPQLNLTGFAFNPQINQATNANWFTEVTLPSVVQTVFLGVVPDAMVQDGQALPVGTLSLNPTAVGAWILATDAIVSDALDFVELDIKGGDPQTINVTPEPASLGLLALGALAVVRRRRSR